MNFKDKIITLENNKKYLVLDIVEYEDRKYIFLINNEDETDSIFREVLAGDNLKLKEIDQELFKNKIFPLFLNKFKDYK